MSFFHSRLTPIDFFHVGTLTQFLSGLSSVLERVLMAICTLDAKIMRHFRENVIRRTATCVEIVADPF
jgi:uncharacterized protein YkvS